MRTRTTVAAVLVAILSGATSAWAQLPAGVEQKQLDQLPRIDRVDGAATAFLYRMGWEELKAKLAGTTALAVIQDPEMQAFFAEVLRMGDRGDKIGPAYKFLVNASIEELTLKAHLVSPPGGDQDDGGKSRSVYGLEIRPSPAGRAAFDQQRQAAIKAVKESGLLPPVGAKLAGEPIKIGATQFDVYGEDDRVIYSAWDGQTLYLAGSPHGAKALAAPLPEAGKSLARSPMFGATVGPLLAGQSSGPIALYYHDLRPFWKNKSAGPAAQAWETLSWRSLDAMAGASFVEGKGFRNRWYWKVGPKRTGLFKHTVGGRVNEEWLKRVPADASAFITGYWDVTSLMGSVAGLVPALIGFEEPDEVLKGMPEGIAEIKPLLDTFGSRYLYYRVPCKYGAFPVANVIPGTDAVLVFELKDAAGFERELDKLLKEDVGFVPVRKITVAGHSVRTINLMLLTVYLTVTKNELIVACHPQLLRDALETWNKPGPSVLDTPAYKAAAGRLVKDPCFIWYIAPGGLVRGIYDHYIPVLQQLVPAITGLEGMFGGRREAAKPNAAFDPMALPRGSVFTRHVTEATILSAHDDGAGVLFDGYAPVVTTPYWYVGLAALTYPHEFGYAPLGVLLYYVAVPPQEPPAFGPPGQPGAVEPDDDQF